MRSKLVEKIVETEKGHTDGTDNTDFWRPKGLGRIYSFLNPVSYLEAIKHQELFGQMDGLFADGVLLVWAIRVVYGIKVHRRSFDMTSLAPVLLKDAVAHDRSVYIVASKQDELARATVTLRERFQGINIIGYRNGFFDSEQETEAEARHIVEIQPDLLIVGLGTVMQECFLLKVKEAGFKGVGFTCGGFIHQASQKMLDYYPKWIDRMNLRFLYRIWNEPHTRKRYLKAALLFPVKFIGERWEK